MKRIVKLTMNSTQIFNGSGTVRMTKNQTEVTQLNIRMRNMYDLPDCVDVFLVQNSFLVLGIPPEVLRDMPVKNSSRNVRILTTNFKNQRSPARSKSLTISHALHET